MITLPVFLLSALSFGQVNGPWWQSAVFYQIFVRSFQDSNGDGIGDLRGITGRMNYLNDLGVNALWLTPIFKSPSYHGYDVVDYKAVDPAYGTMADFDRLIAEAHRRGIRVILDIPLNHTSYKHEWFIESAGLRPRFATSGVGASRDFYQWSEQNPGWPGDHWHFLNNAFYYGFFGSGMPDLNLRNKKVIDALSDVLEFWARRGVDGFRLDAARYFVEGPHGEPDTSETHQLIQYWTRLMKSRFPQLYFVGEIWADAPTIGSYVNSGSELDMAFDFPLSYGLLDSLRDGNVDHFAGTLQYVSQSARLDRLGTFLTNHDQIRMASQVGDQIDKMKLGAFVLLTLPGTPFIYYGEEIGLVNGVVPNPQDDLGKRTPMPWTSDGGGRGFTTGTPWNPFSSGDEKISVGAQAHDVHSLLRFYHGLIHIRESHAALLHGDFEPLGVPAPGVFVFARRVNGALAVGVMNFGNGASPVFDMKVTAQGLDAAHLRGELLVGHTEPGFSVIDGGANIVFKMPSLAPSTALLYEVAK